MNDDEHTMTNAANAGPTLLLTPEEKFNRIAEAAYLRAAARGFAAGDPMRDWLDAEADLMKAIEHDN